jgi:hypothetical protein
MNIKSLITAIFVLSSFPFFAKGQVALSDRQKENIKGDVSCITEMNEYYYEEWGETKRQLDTLRRIFFNQAGNYFIQQYYDLDNHYVTKFYYRDEDGRLSHVDYRDVNREIRSEEYGGRVVGLGSFSISLARNGSYLGRDSYEYDSDGRLKSITWENSERELRSTWAYIYRGNGLRDENIDIDVVKNVYVYKPDGFSIIYCDWEGRTIKRETYSDDGRMMTDNMYTYVLDDIGRRIAYGGSFVASNGIASGSVFYGYNKNGDLAIVTTRSEALKEVDNAPWLSTDYTYSGETIYEYEYDEHGNWVRRKEYETKYNGKSLQRVTFRQYEYGKYDCVAQDTSSAASDLLEEARKQWDLFCKGDKVALFNAYDCAKKVLDTHDYESEAVAHALLAIIWSTTLDYRDSDTSVEDLYGRCCVIVSHCEKAIQMLPADKEDAKKMCEGIYEAVMDQEIMSPAIIQAGFIRYPESPEKQHFTALFCLKLEDDWREMCEEAPGRIKKSR